VSNMAQIAARGWWMDAITLWPPRWAITIM
jgi:hypothetical protein